MSALEEIEALSVGFDRYNHTDTDMVWPDHTDTYTVWMDHSHTDTDIESKNHF